MLQAEYEAIIALHCKLPLRSSLDVLVKTFAHVPGHVLRAIISTHFTRWIRKNHYRYASEESKASFFGEFHKLRNSGKPGFVLDMADNMKISPAMLCRLILECYLKGKGGPADRKVVTSMMKDSSLIHDKVLALEVFLCTVNDPFQGPFMDAKRETAGQHYEIRLKDFLREKNIAFLDEDDLREQGYDKTVDVKLSVPAVINGDNIIMWIESKSAFGDKTTHEEYAKLQYHSYVNRFGPGLVIYWCGFIDELCDSPENQIGNSTFFLADKPPEDIRSMVDFM